MYKVTIEPSPGDNIDESITEARRVKRQFNPVETVLEFNGIPIVVDDHSNSFLIAQYHKKLEGGD